MNERAIAFVCAILLTISAILAWHVTISGDQECMILLQCFSIMAVLLSGFVVVCKYM